MKSFQSFITTTSLLELLLSLCVDVLIYFVNILAAVMLTKKVVHCI